MKIKTRVRQLPNGKWVGELKVGFFGEWKAVDRTCNRQFAWECGDKYYHYCQVTSEKEAQINLKEHLSGRYGL